MTHKTQNAKTADSRIVATETIATIVEELHVNTKIDVKVVTAVATAVVADIKSVHMVMTTVVATMVAAADIIIEEAMEKVRGRTATMGVVKTAIMAEAIERIATMEVAIERTVATVVAADITTIEETEVIADLVAGATSAETVAADTRTRRLSINSIRTRSTQSQTTDYSTKTTRLSSAR
jgi:hypothetical protein